MPPKGCHSMAEKMYSMNNTMVVDHRGIFIYLDIAYQGSFHDVTSLHK